LGRGVGTSQNIKEHPQSPPHGGGFRWGQKTINKKPPTLNNFSLTFSKRAENHQLIKILLGQIH